MRRRNSEQHTWESRNNLDKRIYSLSPSLSLSLSLSLTLARVLSLSHTHTVTQHAHARTHTRSARTHTHTHTNTHEHTRTHGKHTHSHTIICESVQPFTAPTEPLLPDSPSRPPHVTDSLELQTLQRVEVRDGAGEGRGAGMADAVVSVAAAARLGLVSGWGRTRADACMERRGWWRGGKDLDSADRISTGLCCPRMTQACTDCMPRRRLRAHGMMKNGMYRVPVYFERGYQEIKRPLMQDCLAPMQTCILQRAALLSRAAC